MKWFNGESLWKNLFSSTWRINGWMYVFYITASYILYFLLSSALSSILWTQNIAWLIYLVIVLVLTLAFLIIIIMSWIKRFHDIWKNWWNMFLFLIPIYNIIVWLKLMFQLWDKEKNNYWEKPEQTNKTMKTITIISFVVYIAILTFFSFYTTNITITNDVQPGTGNQISNTITP